MYKKRLRICYLCLLTMIIFIMIIALKVEGNIVQAYTKLQGEGTIDRPFLIQNEEDYVEFAKAVSEEKNHYTNQFVRITADLDFSKINMTVGVNDDHETYFSGVLDGMGHKISNVYLNQGDGPSGLFLNLNGLITNLQVENGIISGTSAGGIVGSVHDSGKVLNCCNKATVIGDTEDGIVGEFIGQVENCYGIDMILNDEEAGFENYETEENGEENNDEQLQKYVDKLNANLDMLSVNEEYHNWCRWEVREGEISLTESMEHVVNAIKTKIHMNENIITLKAFSGNDGNWYFALIVLSLNQMKIQLLFS